MSYTIQYIKDEDGYTAQVINWPDVVACGSDFEECRSMLISALKEMITDYKDDGKEIPVDAKDVIIENISLEVASVS